MSNFIIPQEFAESFAPTANERMKPAPSAASSRYSPYSFWKAKVICCSTGSG